MDIELLIFTIFAKITKKKMRNKQKKQNLLLAKTFRIIN